jgi:GxGYxYP putative glycoside hydrolase C-terminal domain/GxGYxYP_N second domain/GxGYxYP third domain/GxGYxYP_N 1st domain
MKFLAMFIMLIIVVTGAAFSGAPDEQYIMHLSMNWEIAGDLPTQAMLISLQGIANTDEPRLYFLYPDNWDFNFSGPLLEYYRTSRGMHPTELTSADEALKALARYAKGYVVWDRNVRTSLVVAFTSAGINRAVVVSEELIPLVAKCGLNMLEDLRGKFIGQSDVEIYRWAYKHYWSKCSRDFLVYLGGEAGKVMKPGIADFGIANRTFFTDASTSPEDTAEYEFADHLFSEMRPASVLLGWHSYAKDLEAEYVTLASHYGIRVEGLHSLPNMSFNRLIALPAGYKFKNNPHVAAGRTYAPEKKVYIACIQSDGLGLGAWVKPERGSIPYAWEASMNWLWLAPAMLQFFYDSATPNDFFIGCLSGPGYMYPKAIPTSLLPEIVDTAYAFMKKLDLNVFEIMDHANYWISDGYDDDLPKSIVDTYYGHMPGAIGFVSGYRPGHTFAVKDGRPFISYDYYLSETRDEKEAAMDLEELAKLNAKRPYFLLLHVREFSDIPRVKRILKQIGNEFEVVPLDVFLKMAGDNPTFETRYGKALN